MRIPAILMFILSGIFFASAFLVSNLYFFSIIGLTLLLFGINKEPSLKKNFLYGWFVGLCIYGSAFLWTWNTFPVKWIAADNLLLQYVSIGSYWFVTSLVVSVSVGLFSLLAKFLLEKTTWALLILPSMWVLHEVLSSVLFSIYSLGNGSGFTIEFGFGYIGYLLVKHELISLAAGILGVYSLSYIGALCSVACFFFLFKQLHRKIIPKVIIVTVLLSLLVSPLVLEKKYVPTGESVLTVETYLDKKFEMLPNKVLRKQEIMLEALRQALEVNANVIILPEESRVTDIFETTDDLFAWVQAQSPVFEGIIIDSGRNVDERGEIVMRAFMYDTRTSTYTFFDKQYLTPQGEYLPYFQKFIFSKLMSEEQFAVIDEGLVYREGIVLDSLEIGSDYPALLFCFESVNTMGVQEALDPRYPSFVAHLVSHTWFVEAYSLWSQLDGMLATQAIWNNIPIVSASNMSQNKLYLPNGDINEGETLATGEYWSLKLFEI